MAEWVEAAVTCDTVVTRVASDMAGTSVATVRVTSDMAGTSVATVTVTSDMVETAASDMMEIGAAAPAAAPACAPDTATSRHRHRCTTRIGNQTCSSSRLEGRLPTRGSSTRRTGRCGKTAEEATVADDTVGMMEPARARARRRASGRAAAEKASKTRWAMARETRRARVPMVASLSRRHSGRGTPSGESTRRHTAISPPSNLAGMPPQR